MTQPSIPPERRPELDDAHVLHGLSSKGSREVLSASLSAGEALRDRIQNELGSDGFCPTVLQAVYLRERFLELTKAVFQTLVIKASTEEHPILCLVDRFDFLERTPPSKEPGGIMVPWSVDIDPVVVAFVRYLREFQAQGHPAEAAEHAAFVKIAYDLAEFGEPILERRDSGPRLSLYEALQAMNDIPIEDSQIRSNVLLLISDGRVSPDCATEREADTISELKRVMLSDQQLILNNLAESFSISRASSLDEMSFTPTRELYKSTHGTPALRNDSAFRWQFAISAAYEGFAALKSRGVEDWPPSISKQIDRVLARVARLIVESDERLKSREKLKAPTVVLQNTRDYAEYYRYMRQVLEECRPRLEQFFGA
jgi:hypothetical protein